MWFQFFWTDAFLWNLNLELRDVWKEAGPATSSPAGADGCRGFTAPPQPLPGSAAPPRHGSCSPNCDRLSGELFSVAQSAPAPLLSHDLGSHITLGNKYLSASMNSRVASVVRDWMPYTSRAGAREASTVLCVTQSPVPGSVQPGNQDDVSLYVE